MGRHVVCYDELYIHNCTAAKFGDMVAQKVRQHQGQFEAFIIDAHGGRIREIGSGVLPRVQYSKELERHGVKSNTTGHGFLSGSDDVPGREMKLRTWININEKGVTELLVVTARCPNLCREFNRFKKKFANGYVTDEGNRRSNCHAIETLEYAAAHGLKYVKPKQKRVVRGIVGEIMRGRSMRSAQRAAKGKGPSSNTITLGPRGE